MTVPDWWRRPRLISVVVDNPSWILPHAETLVEELQKAGERAALIREPEDVPEGGIAFFLGCVRLAPPSLLRRSQRNLVVHESDLPQGRGFSPLTWQILEGCDVVPICLLEAAEQADAGAVIYRDRMVFEGHELIDEMRAVQASKTLDLCRRFLAAETPPQGKPQRGAASHYPRRRPADSALDPALSLVEQFNLLRVVDNQRYPAFFDHAGHRYVLRIEKDKRDGT